MSRFNDEDGECGEKWGDPFRDSQVVEGLNALPSFGPDINVINMASWNLVAGV